MLNDHSCTTALDLYRLLRHFNLHNELLSVPSSGRSRHRFREAKIKVLTWLALEGSPHIDHMCSECTEIIPDPDVEGGALGQVSSLSYPSKKERLADFWFEINGP